MNISILGSGAMGTTLAMLWQKKGHHIFFGSRTPERLAELAKSPNVSTGSYAEAVAYSGTILLATGWQSTQAAIQAAGSLSGKVLIDLTNPEVYGDGIPYHHEVGHSTSGAEIIAGWAEGAKVVKAFNHFYGGMLKKGTQFGDDRAMTFYCGDDAEAKHIVKTLSDDLDIDSTDAGDLKMARYLEPLSALWVHLANAEGSGDNIALKILRRENS